MGSANRLVGYLASVASASLFYVVWLAVIPETAPTSHGDVSILFRIELALFFWLVGGKRPDLLNQEPADGTQLIASACGSNLRSATAALIGLGEDVFVLAVANDEGALALLLAPHELETS